MLVYNGDHDMCVPHTGAEAWTASLRLPVQDRWRPWYTEGQVWASQFPARWTMCGILA